MNSAQPLLNDGRAVSLLARPPPTMPAGGDDGGARLCVEVGEEVHYPLSHTNVLL
jgi:hypothetical protein